MHRIRLASLLGAAALLAGAAFADTPEQQYHRAYYLEHEQGDYATAAEIYAQVAESRNASAELRQRAREAAAGCREESVSSDLARLVPESTLFYAELNRPGGQLKRLLEQLGLLAKAEAFADTTATEPRFTISPDLIDAIFGIRGAAVAVTGFDFQREHPTGVVIVHPGDLKAIRGLVQSVLPIAFEAADPIGGFPTFSVDGDFYITYTRRLLIAGPNPIDIRGVIDRLHGDERSTLADSGRLGELLRQRDDALLFACLNAKPAGGLIDMLMSTAGSEVKEARLAQALLDPKSFEYALAKAGVSDDGVSLELSLHLSEGHKNLVFNLLRAPALDTRTLRRMPAGSAVVMAGAFNDVNSRYQAAMPSAGEQPVTLMDLGREIFANTIGFGLFVMPPESARQPVPGAGLVLTVHDVGKSRALWGEILGIASLASGAGRDLEGERVRLDGQAARRYALPENMSVYLATSENQVWVASTESALRGIAAARDGGSIYDDPGFRAPLSALDEDGVFALLAAPARSVKLAMPFARASDLANMQKVHELLRDTAVTMTVTHSHTVWRAALRVNGLPDIGPLVARAIASERDGHPFALLTPDEEVRAFEAAVNEIDVAPPQALRHMARMHHERGAQDAAREAIERFVKAARDDAEALNNFAWDLVTESAWDGAYNRQALEMARRCNTLTNHENWMYVDTLAHACFATGNVQDAVAFQRRAVELCGDSRRREDAERALARFEAALPEADGAVNN